MLKKIFLFPLTRIVIGFFVITLIYGLSQFAIGKLLDFSSLATEYKDLLAGIVGSAIAVFTYIFLFRFYEQREITEFSASNIGFDLSAGILLGFILQSLTILVIYLFGGYTVESFNGLLVLLPALTMGFTSAIVEEILLRGIVFRIAEESLGSYIALLISAIFFGAMHIGNPNANFITSAGIAIQAGLLLGVAYMYTRNLWFPIAIHFAWNFSQSGIYGARVSGHTIDESLLTSNIEGPTLWTGGAFGPEGSVQATIFCVIAMLILFQFCRKNGQIISPFWKRNTAQS